MEKAIIVRLTIWKSDLTIWWLWKPQWHPFKKRQTMATPKLLLSITPSGITRTTPTLPCAVYLLKCCICGNLASFHTFYFTFATSKKNHKLKRYMPISTGLSAPHECLWPSHSATCWDRYSHTVHNIEPQAAAWTIPCLPPPLPLFYIFFGN